MTKDEKLKLIDSYPDYPGCAFCEAARDGCRDCLIRAAVGDRYNSIGVFLLPCTPWLRHNRGENLTANRGEILTALCFLRAMVEEGDA